MQLGSEEALADAGAESESTKGYRSECVALQWASRGVGTIEGVIVIMCGTWGSSKSDFVGRSASVEAVRVDV